MEVLKRARERGLSLVETLCALLILSLVAVSILSMFTHGVQLNASGADYTELTNVARDKFEDLMALPWGHADLAATTTQTTDPVTGVTTTSTSNHQETRDGGNMTLIWTVDEYAIDQSKLNLPEAMADGLDFGGGNIKVITITVVSQRAALLGQRDVTIRGVRAAL